MQKILCFVIAGLVGLVLAEGTITETKATQGNPSKYTLAWTAPTNGIVSQATTFYVRGELARVVLDGTSTGATYSLTLKDSSGVDVLAGLGAAVGTNAVSIVGADSTVVLAGGGASDAYAVWTSKSDGLSTLTITMTAAQNGLYFNTVQHNGVVVSTPAFDVAL